MSPKRRGRGRACRSRRLPSRVRVRITFRRRFCNGSLRVPVQGSTRARSASVALASGARYVRMSRSSRPYCVIAVSDASVTASAPEYVRRTALPAGSVTIRHQIGWTTKSTFASCFSASLAPHRKRHRRPLRDDVEVRREPVAERRRREVERDHLHREVRFSHSEEVVHERRDLRLVARQPAHLAEQARAVPALVGPARQAARARSLALMAHPAGSGLGSGRECDGRD